LVAVFLLVASVACQPAKISNSSSGKSGGESSPTGSRGSDSVVDPARPPAAGPGIDLPDAGAGGAMGSGGVGTSSATGQRCAADVFSAEVAPLDLLLLVDSSGSMREKAGAQTKWEMARGALAAFLKDPKSAGLGAGLQFFPYFPPPKACNSDADCGRPIAPRPNFWCHGRSACVGPNVPFSAAARSCDPGLPLCLMGTTCTPIGRCAKTGGDCMPVGMPCAGGIAGDDCAPQPKTCDDVFATQAGSCTSADYEPPVVPIMPLPSAQVALTAALDRKNPEGGTPMAPAVEGALAHLRKHVTANPGRRAVLVLATDGLPQNCDVGNDIATVAAALSAGRAMAPALSTYIIGVFDPATLAGSPGALAMLATAGGSGNPFVLTPGDDLTQKFIDSLNQIRGAALACEFKIPAATATGQIDFGKVNVRISAPTGADDLIYVARADKCDPMRGGWYYDVEPAMGTPTRVLTCPATCTRLKDAKDIKVELLFGCQSRID
jgi:Mg-chelatase subunit ChlD